MDSLSQLEAYSNSLATATKTLLDYSRDAVVGSSTHLIVSRDAPYEVHRARRNILAIVARLETLLAEPADLIQHLANQNQLLACLKWLGEFQVLAYIPLTGSVSIKDVAELTGVPEIQLCRTVRMTATAGFLYEPKPYHVAHTALSASFVTKLSYLDATMFLGETAAPVALHMAEATQRQDHSSQPSKSTYSLAFNTSQTFQSACEQRTKLQRQWSSYCQCVSDQDESVMELLSQLDWRSWGNACVVDVGAHSTETASALAELYPALHFIVQLSESASMNGAVEVGKAKEHSNRIIVQKRAYGARQTVKDAAVYILHLPARAVRMPSHPLSSRILAELQSHLDVLSANSESTMLVLAPRVLPEPGFIDSNVEATARAHDLARSQLANEREMDMGELMDIVNSVHDSKGWLVVVNKFRSRNSATVLLSIRYQTYGDRHHDLESIML